MLMQIGVLLQFKGWNGVGLELYCFLTLYIYIPLDFIKFFIKHSLSARASEFFIVQRMNKSLTIYVSQPYQILEMNISPLQVDFIRKRKSGNLYGLKLKEHFFSRPLKFNIDRNNRNELNQMDKIDRTRSWDD